MPNLASSSKLLITSLMALVVVSCAWKNPNKPFKAPTVNGSERFHTIFKEDLSQYMQDKGLHQPALDADNGFTYTAMANGAVIALDPRGEQVWQVTLDENIYSGVVIAGNNLIVVDAEADLIAINKESGQIAWRQTLSSSTWALPYVKGNRIFIHTFDGQVHALSLIDGKKLWSYQYNLPDVSLAKIPAVSGWQKQIILGQANGMVVGLNEANGTLLWQVRIAEEQGTGVADKLVDVDAEIHIDGNYALVSAYNGQLVAIDLTKGVIVWDMPIQSTDKILLNDGTLIVADLSGDVIAYEFPAKNELWFNDSLHHRKPQWLMAFNDEEFFATDYQGYLYLINYKTGKTSNLGKTFGEGLSGKAVMPKKELLLVQTKLGVLYLFNFKIYEEEDEDE
jgi:outer membrane protein assembly factor BamB